MTKPKSTEHAVCAPVETGRSAHPGSFSAYALAVSLAVGLAGCSSVGGTTYGTGESQEAALLKDVSSFAGIIPQEKEAPIDYSNRAGLVLPPKGTPLPAPQDASRQASSTAANWPQDPDRLRALYHERLQTMTEAERQELLAAIRKLPPEQRDAIIKNDPRKTDFAKQIKEPDPMKASADALAEYERQVQERKALIRLQNGEGSQGRKYLTQPPERFTETTPEIERELARIDPKKQKKKNTGLFGSLWPF